MASQNEVHFTSLLGPIFKDFGNPNGCPNSVFEAFRRYFSMRLSIQFWPIVGGFGPEKEQVSLGENNDCYKMGVFDKTKIAQFCLCFQRPKRKKSIQKSNPKTSCFSASNLKGFSFNFGCIESKNH